MEYRLIPNARAEFLERFRVFLNRMVASISNNNPSHKNNNPRNLIVGKKENDGSYNDCGKKANGKEYIAKPYTGARVLFNRLLPVHILNIAYGGKIVNAVLIVANSYIRLKP